MRKIYLDRDSNPDIFEFDDTGKITREKTEINLPENLGTIKSNLLKITDEILSYRNIMKIKQDLTLCKSNHQTFSDYLYLGIVIDGGFEGGFWDSKPMSFYKNQMIINTLSSSKGFMRLDGGTNTKTLGFLIKKDFITENLPNLDLNTKHAPLIIKNLNNKNLLLAHKIYNTDESQPFYKLRIQSMIIDFILDEFLNIYSKNNELLNFSTRDFKALNAARDILIESLEALSIAQVARMVGLNEFKLKRGFKEIFKETPHQLSLRNRLITAKYYLENTEISIGEISAKVGFKSQQNFTVAFKRYYQCPPSEFRATHKNKLEKTFIVKRSLID